MKKKNIFILIFFILAVVAYHVFGYIGHYGYDDVHYAKLAVDFNRGIHDYTDHFTYRTPIILLTALSYSVFGFSDSASAIPSLLIAIAIVVIVYKLLKNKGPHTLITGLALTVLSNWFIFYSDKLMPDLYVALSILLSLFLIHQYKFSSRKKDPFLYSVLLSFSLLFGFMAKGTVILFIPVLVFFICVDFLLKRDRRFWVYTIVAGVVVFAAYFIIIGLITGDVFKRFEAIVNNSYLNLCSYEKQPVAILLKRIAYQFFVMLVYQTMATGYIFLIAFLVREKSSGYFKINDSFSFWIASAFVLLLSSNFMSISLTSYSPMCLDPRHYLFLVPVVSIPASAVVAGFIKRKTYGIQIVLTIISIAVVAVFLEGKGFFYHYIPLLFLFGVYMLLKPARSNQIIFVILFVAVMALMPATMIDYAQKVKYKKQKEIFETYILNSADSCTVITNDVQKNLGNYYNKFRDDGVIRFLNYKEFNDDTADHRKKILFMNGYTRNLSGMGFEDLPYYARNISENNELIYRDEELKIEIYEMNEILIPKHSFRKLMYSKNTFEEQIINWSQNDSDISTERKYAGTKSIRLGEYSSSFEYELDSLDLDSVSQLSVMCSVYCCFFDKTNAKLVVSVENQDGAYIWYGLEINKFIKAYSNWWPVQHEVTVNKKDIKKDSWIKVYLWNMEKQKAFVDDFEITIAGY